MSPTERRLSLTAAEVRAWQAGGRELRRVVKPQPVPDKDWWGGWVLKLKVGDISIRALTEYRDAEVYSPFGGPGDVLVLRHRYPTPRDGWNSATIGTARVLTSTVEKVDGVWWWVCAVEEIVGEKNA